MTAPVAVATRVATTDDLDFLADAHRLGHRAVADARGGELDTLLRGRAEPIAETFQDDLDNASSHIWVATADGLAVGYLVAKAIDLRSGETMLRVVDLWVHPEARGIGLGSALMNNALDLAKAHSMVGVDARALPGDRVTKNFFETFGLVARAIEVFRRL